MPSRVPPIARIRLARSLPRLLALPTALAVIGLVAATAGLILLPWPASIGAALAGALLVLAAAGWAAHLLSIRLDVEEAAVRVHWLGGERLHVLAPGPVTRVRLRGERASSLRSGSRWRGYDLGTARLRGEETIQVVRLAPTRTAILVPTEGGRLAVAAASEEELLDALARAARARERLAEVAGAAPPVEAPQPTEPEPQPKPEPLPEAEPIEATEPEPRALTGIERAMLEERLAREREAAETAAEAERIAAAQAFESAQLPPVPDASALPGPRPAEVAAHDRETSAREVRERRRPGWLRRPEGRLRLGRPKPSAAFVVLPLVGAAAVWLFGLTTDRLPEPGSDLGRLTALALVLAGPATSVGAIMARAWWPRLVGVVVSGGLVASVFIARALIPG